MSAEIREGIDVIIQQLIGQSGFQLSVVEPKPKQLLTNYTTQPISNRSKTKTKTKTNVIV